MCVCYIYRVCVISLADAWLIWASSVSRTTFLHRRTSVNHCWRPWNSQWPIRRSEKRDTPTRSCRRCESSCRDADRYSSHLTIWVMSMMGCIHKYYGMQVWIEEEALTLCCLNHFEEQQRKIVTTMVSRHSDIRWPLLQVLLIYKPMTWVTDLFNCSLTVVI